MPPDRNAFMVPESCWLLPDWTIDRLPVNCGNSISATSPCSATLLEVIFQTLRGSVMNHSVNVLKIYTHAQSNSGENNPYNSVRNQKALEDDILVVLTCVGMKHPKETVVTEVGCISGLV